MAMRVTFYVSNRLVYKRDIKLLLTAGFKFKNSKLKFFNENERCFNFYWYQQLKDNEI